MQHDWWNRTGPEARPWRKRLWLRRRRLLSLALQGGGSFGSFTWGVLDRLLQDDRVVFDAVSGTSAGAVNAVVLASGLAEGGREEAREKLQRFWKRVSNAAPRSPFGHGPTASTAFELSARVVSPYQFNPLGLNPLRDILAEEVDFARLRRASSVRLLIAATRVKDGRMRLFRENEITLEAVLASACLPQLHHAVEIEGEAYWDGGYSANPPLRQLVIDSRTPDVLLVQITPEEQEGVPRLPSNIARRLSHIAFNGPLQKEIEALSDLCALCKKAGFFRPRFCRRLERLRLHRIVAEHAIHDLHGASALNLDWAFLTRLKESGYGAADAWLTGTSRSMRDRAEARGYRFAV
jgi:NTE family protein